MKDVAGLMSTEMIIGQSTYAPSEMLTGVSDWWLVQVKWLWYAAVQSVWSSRDLTS